MMNRNEVKARLAEAAAAIKGELDARRLEAAAAIKGQQDARRLKAAEKVAAGRITGAKRRRGRFWVEERGFKYVDDVEDHLRRLFRAFDTLDPPQGSSVFEIGPGNCYLLFMCREMQGCRVAGVDWKLAEGPAAVNTAEKPLWELGLYAQGLFRRQLGMEEAVRHQVVREFEPVDFRGRYDAIVATHTAFNVGWGVDAYRYWLRDSYEHLNPDGRLMVAINEIQPAVLAALPLLRPPQPTRRFRKLTLLTREAIGRMLAEKS
jgi:hypothetical protein